MAKNNNVRNSSMTIVLIAALVMSAIVFLIPMERPAAFWITYGAELLAIILQFPIFWLAYRNANTAEKRLFAFPVFTTGYTYLLAQTVTSAAIYICILIWEDFPVWLTWLISIIILGVFAAWYIVANNARESVVELQNQKTENTKFMYEARAKFEILKNRASDESVKAKLNDLYQLLRLSDPVSNSSTANIESELMYKFSVLEDAIQNSSSETVIQVADEIIRMANERNTMCKNGK